MIPWAALRPQLIDPLPSHPPSKVTDQAIGSREGHDSGRGYGRWVGQQLRLGPSSCAQVVAGRGACLVAEAEGRSTYAKRGRAEETRAVHRVRPAFGPDCHHARRQELADDHCCRNRPEDRPGLR